MLARGIYRDECSTLLTALLRVMKIRWWGCEAACHSPLHLQPPTVKSLKLDAHLNPANGSILPIVIYSKICLTSFLILRPWCSFSLLLSALCVSSRVLPNVSTKGTCRLVCFEK
uniref:Uncharacterized protein n=1 Tax=Physcomitrium patens TaxID=3218 RepID=A0A2K1KN38_PHYPA|nr:hypothetical protein PHYPA_006089 [Physcomitrium patens]